MLLGIGPVRQSVANTATHTLHFPLVLNGFLLFPVCASHKSNVGGQVSNRKRCLPSEDCLLFVFFLMYLHFFTYKERNFIVAFVGRGLRVDSTCSLCGCRRNQNFFLKGCLPVLFLVLGSYIWRKVLIICVNFMEVMCF